MTLSVSHADLSIYEAGQRWTYRSPAGFEASRIIIGAILFFEDQAPVACVAVEDAPQRRADASTTTGSIPFLPLTLDALHRTVETRDGSADLPESFAASFLAWRDDERGLSYFTVPFEGHLDRMIARQMADLSAEPTT
jgi:hypothetical protein